MNKTSNALDRLHAGIVEAPETGCWEWRHSLTLPGYGRIRSNGTQWLAHRFAYTALVGPIPDGLVIDHLCRNKVCVNPSHLQAVTQRVNVMRGNSFAAKNAVATHCSHGHEFSETNTHVTALGHRRCRTCGRRDHRRRSTASAQETQGADVMIVQADTDDAADPAA